MAYIYMDESGDLGFDFSKKRTSNCFVVTFLFVINKRPLEKVVRRTLKSFPARIRKVHPGPLHCAKEKPATRLKVLQLVNELDVSIMAIYLNKRKVFTRLQDEKQVLYNYVTNMLLDRVYNRRILPRAEAVHLVASRRETNKFLNENFRSYLADQLMTQHKTALTVEIRSPAEDRCLQVADFVCWSLFRKREYGDESYYNVIKQRVIEESPLFP
jgi:hypothetical protein